MTPSAINKFFMNKMHTIIHLEGFDVIVWLHQNFLSLVYSCRILHGEDSLESFLD